MEIAINHPLIVTAILNSYKWFLTTAQFTRLIEVLSTTV